MRQIQKDMLFVSYIPVNPTPEDLHLSVKIILTHLLKLLVLLKVLLLMENMEFIYTNSEI